MVLLGGKPAKRAVGEFSPTPPGNRSGEQAETYAHENLSSEMPTVREWLPDH